MRIVAILMILLSLNNFAISQESMRRCMLLPITDTINGDLGFKVYEEVEKYLKESQWCYYRPNSEVLNILGGYKKNLKEYLENSDVLKVLAEKTKSGTLIRIAIETTLNGTRLSLSVIGENGVDLYLNEEVSIQRDQPDNIAQIAINWIREYEKTIPYVGRVTGILNDQITIDAGSDLSIHPQDKLIVIRPTKKKQHPLLKEIVDWETQKIAEIRPLQINSSQTLARIENLTKRNKIEINDWIIKDEIPSGDLPNRDKQEKQLNNLGEIRWAILVGSGSYQANTTESNNSLQGLMFGASINGELWITRNYIAELELLKTFGSYSKDAGEFTGSDFGGGKSQYKLMGKYRFLPLGYYFGPRIDGSIGYAKYYYPMTFNETDKTTSAAISGIMLGIGGGLPLNRQARLYMNIDFLLTTSYQEDIVVHGTVDSISNYTLKIGGVYQFNENLKIDSSINFVSNTVKFSTIEKELVFKDSSINVGTVFNF